MKKKVPEKRKLSQKLKADNDKYSNSKGLDCGPSHNFQRKKGMNGN